MCVFSSECALGFIHVITPEFRSEGRWDIVLSFDHRGPRDGTQIIKSGGIAFLFTEPSCWFYTINFLLTGTIKF